MKEQIFEIVKGAVEELLEEQGLTDEVNADFIIYAGDDGIDSLSLVRLVTSVEMDVNDAFSSDVILASEKAMSMKNSPYRNVGAFVDFIANELAAEQ